MPHYDYNNLSNVFIYGWMRIFLYLNYAVYNISQEGTVRLIWAYHPEDPSPSGKISYHATQRGVRSVSLVNHQPKQPVIPADSINIDLLHDKVRFQMVLFSCEINKDVIKCLAYG